MRSTGTVKSLGADSITIVGGSGGGASFEQTFHDRRGHQGHRQGRRYRDGGAGRQGAVLGSDRGGRQGERRVSQGGRRRCRRPTCASRRRDRDARASRQPGQDGLDGQDWTARGFGGALFVVRAPPARGLVVASPAALPTLPALLASPETSPEIPSRRRRIPLRPETAPADARRRRAVDLLDQHAARRVAAGARAIDQHARDGARRPSSDPAPPRAGTSMSCRSPRAR